MRRLLSTAGPADRAGLLSAIYLISYCGAAIPGFITGRLAGALSLMEIALGYEALALLACVVVLLGARNPAAPEPASSGATPSPTQRSARARHDLLTRTFPTREEPP